MKTYANIEANASLTSKRSTSSTVMPARASAMGIAIEGPCEAAKSSVSTLLAKKKATNVRYP